jgi:hypothetical protein
MSVVHEKYNWWTEFMLASPIPGAPDHPNAAERLNQLTQNGEYDVVSANTYTGVDGLLRVAIVYRQHLDVPRRIALMQRPVFANSREQAPISAIYRLTCEHRGSEHYREGDLLKACLQCPENKQARWELTEIDPLP